MPNVTHELTRSLKPELAVMVYKDPEYGGFAGGYYLESHQINEEGQILEGKPLLQETIGKMVDLFFDQRQDGSQVQGYVPECILKYVPTSTGYELIWYHPAEVRMLFFADVLKIPSGKAWVPGLIYHVKNDGLNIYAFTGTKRPAAGTKLYRAPFHNISDRGDVCLGSAKVKKPADKTFASIMKYWEDLFWLSEFSHLNGATNPVKTKLGPIWKKLIKTKPTTKWSTLNELLPLKNITMKQLLK